MRYQNFSQFWKKILFALLTVFGFLTYTNEALQFVNDPIDISKHPYSPYFKFFKHTYILCCFMSLAVIIYYTYLIFRDYRLIPYRHKVYFLFTLYFVFTINLCELKSYTEWQHVHILRERRKSPFGHHHKQLLRYIDAILLPCQ